MPLFVPYSHRYDGRCLRRTKETFSFFYRYFDTVTVAEITWQPWVTMPAGVKDQFARSWEASCYRLLFEGPICQACFLDEQFLCQTMGLPESVVPMAPLPSIRATERLTFQEMIQFTKGLEADYFCWEGDYSTFIRTHLMPHLTDICEGEKAGAPAARERARVPRAARAPPGYTEDLLELLALFEGMILKREALLGFYGIQVPPIRTAPAAVAARVPTMPPPTIGRRERQALIRSRGRARGTRDESGPSEPILSDDDAETSGSEKAVSPQPKSSKSGDDGDSGSESGDADAKAGLERERVEMTTAQTLVQIQRAMPTKTVPQSPFL